MKITAIILFSLFVATFALAKSPLIAVMKNNHAERSDKSGKIKFESVYFDNGPDEYSEGLARFIKKGKIGFHDENGKVVLKASYDFATPFADGKSVVCDGCWSTYDANAKFRAASSSPCPQSLNDAHMTVKGGKWGAINAKGEFRHPTDFEFMGRRSHCYRQEDTIGSSVTPAKAGA